MKRIRHPRAVEAACAGLVVAEVVGYLAIWVPIPMAWMWLGARVYDATLSIGLDLLVAFGGFFATTLVTMRGLTRIDALWVELRRRAGHDQKEGVLTRVVVVATTIAMIVFWIWFHILEDAFIIPFMPNR